MKFHENRSNESRVIACEQTDMTNLSILSNLSN